MLLGQDQPSTGCASKLEAPAALATAATLSAAIVTKNSTQEKVVFLWFSLLRNFVFELGVQAATALLANLTHQG